MDLTTLDPKNLTIFGNDRDILRDLFTYLDYVGEHDVKRMTRSNEIPKADSVRIAKLLGDPELVQMAQETGGTQWVDFLDDLALRLQLVSYDLEGEYRGYTSSETSFIENYIIINQSQLQIFGALSPAKQEQSILKTLIHASSRQKYDNTSQIEFYNTGQLGILDPFSTRGAGTGIMPTLKFPEIRQFLLTVLKNCSTNQWVSTESLIAYLKINHPYFLIPQKLPIPGDKWETITSRYGNFYEGKDRYSTDKPIPDDAPDAFERVEGRYVERFLEGIPLTMRFVEVAYDLDPYQGLLPKRGMLKGFRINERFQLLLSDQESTPKITVQPNFDVVIESDFYPASVIRQVAALGEQVSSPNSGHGAYVGIFLLKKAAVAAAQVKDPQLDVIKLLKDISQHELPANVKVELDEWAGHADQFTLYEGFALLEVADAPSETNKFITERISPTLNLARSPEKVFSTLETLGHVPVRIQHPDGKFAPITQSAQSVFPKESLRLNAPKTARPVKVSRAVIISYQFPDDEAFVSIKKMLAELRCPFQSDPVTRVVSIQQKEQAKFTEAIQILASDFLIEIE